MTTRSVIAALAASAVLLTGCASAPAHDTRDPLEPFNRSVDAFNQRVDDAALRPAAKAYERAVPRVVRSGVSNFFGNLGDAWSAVNSALQLNAGDAAQNGMRFAFNTVFGFAGVLDIATDVGIERHKEDFGSTLARWGVPPGPYLVLPLLGPSTLRDAAALPVDVAGYPLAQVTPVATRNAMSAGRAVDTRAKLLPLDAALDQALDRYTFMREAYLQYRQAQVNPGVDTEEEAPGSRREANDTAQAGAPE